MTQNVVLYWIDPNGDGHLSFAGRIESAANNLHLSEEKLREILWIVPPGDHSIGTKIPKFRVSPRVESTNSRVYAVTFYKHPPLANVPAKEFFAV